MNARWNLALAALLVLAPLRFADAAIINFQLTGNAGLGLLPGNENPPGTGGTGGLGPGGITYDDVTNVLSLDIAWGSANGFTDLTGDVSSSHIHGFTLDSPPAGWSQNAGVLYTLHTLPGFDVSATSGGFVGTVNILETHEAGLLAGRTYINVHTAANPGGEIRGQLSVVPLPAALPLLAAALAAGGLFVRRRSGR